MHNKKYTIISSIVLLVIAILSTLTPVLEYTQFKIMLLSITLIDVLVLISSSVRWLKYGNK